MPQEPAMSALRPKHKPRRSFGDDFGGAKGTKPGKGFSVIIRSTMNEILTNDSTLAALVKQFGPCLLRPSRGNPYEALVASIIGQQLSGKAARTIRGRFFAMYGSETTCPTPQQMLKTSMEQFRATGVSGQKATYLLDLARHVQEDLLDLKNIKKLPDEEVIAQLVAVKGIGEWTAHMFLMFHLGRPDVLPTGDLGVRKGMMMAYNLRKLPTPKRMEQIARPWRPYRSAGSWYMWEVADAVNPVR
ncbi:MAG: DNA-3-methyladenine glycosylase [Candidatus Spechtbacterales bacterium]